MMWNNNDTKYIVKRLILYFLITGIVFFAGQSCAKATVYSVNINNDGVNSCQTTSNTYTWTFASPNFVNVGQGYVIFNLVSQSAGNGQAIIENVSLMSQYNIYTCEINNDINYYDNTTMQHLITAKCPIQGANENLSLVVRKSGSEGTCIKALGPATFVSGENNANQIVNGINNAIQQSITDGNVNAIATQDAIRNASAAEVAAINSATQATQDNTTAINNLNDNIMADYNGPTNSDIDAINSLDGIFTNQDQDVIRGILLFPTRLFIILASALDNNSCVSYSFGYLLGTEIYLPCLNYKNIIGTNLYNIIDIVFGLCVLYGLVRYIIHLYDFIFSVGLKGGVVVAAVEVFK